MIDVVIVGAGIAGLTAAYRCQQAGLSVQILEAQAQAGGRVRSQIEPDTDAVLGDLGPTWVWPKYQPIVQRWLDELSITRVAQFDDGHAVVDRSLTEPPQRVFVPSQDGMTRLERGPLAFVEQLVRHLAPGTLHVNCTVQTVQASASHSTVRFRDTDTRNTNIQIIDANKIVIATPLRVAAQHIRFEPELPSVWLNAIANAPTWMAAQAKVLVQYRDAFWRTDGLSGRVVSQIGPLSEVHDHCGPNAEPAALFGFVGVPADQRAADPDTLNSAILAQLVRCFGQQAANPLHMVCYDWAQNEQTCTELDRRGSGDHPRVLPETLRESTWDGRLRWAVSEVAQTSPGLIEGALDAGESAASGLVLSGPST